MTDAIDLDALAQPAGGPLDGVEVHADSDVSDRDLDAYVAWINRVVEAAERLEAENATLRALLAEAYDTDDVYGDLAERIAKALWGVTP